MYNISDVKECGNLQIITDSIKDFLVDAFSKKIDDILISDLLLVESLTIDGKDFDGKRQIISFQDLKQFKNLKYLEICNTLVTNNSINIISQIVCLENIIFRNCTFSKNVENLNKLTNIKSIKIYKCKKFNISYINKIINIKRIYLSNILISDIKQFSSLNLISLDVSNCIVENFDGVNNLNIKNLVISKRQYFDYKNYFMKCNFKIMILSDIGYYIEKWLN